MRKYLLYLLTLSHLVVLGQTKPNKNITATYNNVSLTTVLLDFEKQTNYRFYYDASYTYGSVSATFKETPISAALETVLKNSGLKFTLDNEDNVFIYKGPSIEILSPQNKPLSEETVNGNNLFEKLKIDTGVFANKKYQLIGKTNGSLNVPVVLSGYLIRLSTKSAVSNAEISIDGRSVVKSDTTGYFSLDIKSGRHTVEIKSPNLQEVSINLEIYASGSLNIGLHEKIQSLKEVVIESVGARRNVEEVAMGVERLDIKRIKKIPTVFGEPDILKVILTLPGVKNTGEASAGFNVRGGATDQNLILFDNMTIYNPTHFLGFFSAFNAEIIKDIELYKSSIPTKYGGRLSSVLEINGINGDSSKIKGSAGIGLITSRLNMEGPIAKGKTTFVFGARTTYSDLFLSALPKAASYKKSSISFYDMNIKLSHKLNKKNVISLTGYLSHDDFKLDSDTTNYYDNKNIVFNWKHDFNPNFQGELVLGYDGYQYNVESTAKPTQAFGLDFGIEQFNGKLNFKKLAWKNHQLNFGFDSKFYKINAGNLAALGTESLLIPINIEPEQALETAVFLNDNVTVSKKLSFDLGIRYSFYNYLGPKNVNFYKSGLPIDEFSYEQTQNFGSGKNIKSYNAPEIRVAAKYSLLRNLSIKASYNTLAQYIHLLSNTTAITPTDIWKLSDNNIKPQSGSQISFGIYNNAANNMIELSVEAYYKKIKDYIDYKSGAKIVLNEQIEREVLNTAGKAYGIEFMLKKVSGKVNGWVSYTYSRTFLRTNNPNGGEIINMGAFYPSNFDKPHDATLVGNYAFSSRFSFSLNATYSTGRPITLPIGKYFSMGSERLLYSDRNEYRVPDYFRMDMSFNLDGNHKLKQRTHNSWNFGFYNITGRDNPYSVFYNQENGRVKGYKLTIFSNPVPFINYNIRF
jgi:hypothetical protein